MIDDPPELSRPDGSRRLLNVAVVAVVSLLMGSAATVAAAVGLGWRPQPEREYLLQVSMKASATAPQLAAVESALGHVPNVREVHLWTRAEAYARSKELFKDNPSMMSYLREDTMPQSFDVTVISDDFTCDGIPNLRTLTGVDLVRVAQAWSTDEPGAQINC